MVILWEILDPFNTRIFMQETLLKKKLAIVGGSGKLGKEALLAISLLPDVEISYLVANKSIGQKDPITNLYYTSWAEVEKVDLVIEIASCMATKKALDFCSEHKIPLIIGSTGHDSQFKKTLFHHAKSFPIFFCENFSFSLAMTLNVIKTLKNHLPRDCYIDIIEKHRAKKKDAPSGTAKKIAEVLDMPFKTSLDTEERDSQNIHIHCIRAHDHTIEHEILFNFLHEQISIKHQVFDRKAYALGLTYAISFTLQQPFGLFGMDDLLYQSHL